jgi:hypothetical protein
MSHVNETWPSHRTYRTGSLEQEPPIMPTLLSLRPLQPSIRGSLPDDDDQTGSMPLTSNAGANMSQPVDITAQRVGPYVYQAGRSPLKTTLTGPSL